MNKKGLSQVAAELTRLLSGSASPRTPQVVRSGLGKAILLHLVLETEQTYSFCSCSLASFCSGFSFLNSSRSAILHGSGLPGLPTLQNFHIS
jgi:hypothetical protein